MIGISQLTAPRLTMAAISTRAPACVPLLVLALLICHGALGSMDKLMLEPTPSVAMHQLQGETNGPGPADERPVEHPPAHGYYTVALLTVLVGAFLGLLFKGAIPTRRIVASIVRIRHDFASTVLYPGPRPTPVFLQVFRL